MSKITRRSFVGTSIEGATALAAGASVLSVAQPAAARRANDKVVLGLIGAGGRGRIVIKNMAKLENVEVKYVCDVEDARGGPAVAELEKMQGSAPKFVKEMQEVFDDKDVDAVVVATPDHWHVLPSIHACQAQKDVYLEKPLTLTIREGRVLVEAVRKHGRVLQSGSQRRSMKNHRIGCELVRNGRAGKIHTVIANNYPSPWECGLPGQPVPEGLDWDVWCGPTEPVPYNKDIYIQRSNPGWISLRPWSGGELTGNGAHGLDQIQWALDMDHTGPVEVWAEGGKLEAPVYTAPESGARGDRLCSVGREITYRYANGVIVKTGDASACGATFIGEKGKIVIGCDTYSSDPPEIAQEPIGESEIHLPVSDNHMQNWFDSIRSREKPIAHVEIGHRSAILCHLGNVARWLGRKLSWDPETETFPGDDEANRYLDRPRRKPYELPDPV